MSNSAVEIQELTRSFGERKALDAVKFSVEAGEIFALLGPNGGGKSTLFRILSTLLSPSSGTAKVFDADVVLEEAKVRSYIGVVFQSPSLDMKLKVRENLWHQGHLYGLQGSALHKRIDELLERFGLSDRGNDYAETLSGGMARRVEIAKGMLHRPRLLLLDEPSTGLDPGARIDMKAQLESIRTSDGVTVLMTTHILDEAETCDRLAILDHGKLVALGTPSALKNEISGNVLSVEAKNIEALRTKIENAMNVQCKIVANSIRIESADAFQLAARLADSYGDDIDAVTVGKPSLEDVFIEKTGHKFWSETIAP